MPDLALPVSLGLQGSAGFATGPWTWLNETSGVAARALGLALSPPGTQGSLVLTVPGSGVSYAGPAWTVAAPPAARLSAVAKTPNLYRSQCRLELAYQLQDAEGRLPVRTEGLTLSFSLSMGSLAWGPSPCGAPSLQSGAGTCAIAACDDKILGWFSAAADTLVLAAVTARDATLARSFSSPALLLTLLRLPPPYTLSPGPGMTVELAAPDAPRYAGDTLDLTLYADTGGYPLAIWGVQLGFNTSAVAWIPGSFAVASALYAPPVLVTDVLGVLVASVSKGQSAPDPAVTSARLQIGTVSFLVTSDAQDTILPNTFTCQVIGMLNTGGNQFVSDRPAQILDLYGGTRFSGALAIAKARQIVLYAFPASASVLVDWSGLGGQPDPVSPLARAVSNRFGTPDADVGSACPSCATAVTTGSGLITVAVTSGALSATLALRVWAPVNATVAVLDPILNRVNATACAFPLYQRTLYSATAVLASGDWSVQADVTGRVALASNDSAVATLEGPYLQGWAPGAAAVTMPGATVPVAGATVVVSNASVAVVRLSVTALTGVLWSPDPVTAQAASVALQSRTLTRSASTALLFVTALFSDGARFLLTASDGAELATADASVLAITPSLFAGAWLARRVVSGNQSVCGPFAVAVWRACGAQLASGAGAIDLEFSPPVSATAAFTDSFLTSPADTWAVQEHGYATGTALTALVVLFADGTSTSYPPSTPGLTLTVTQGQALVTAYGTTLASTGAGAGVVTVAVGLAGMGNVTALYQLQVVASAATGASLACDAVRLAPAADPATFAPFRLASSARLRVTVALLGGGTVDVSLDPRTVYQLLPADTGSVSILQGVLSIGGGAPASVTVSATFFQFATQPLRLPIVAFQTLSAALADGSTLKRLHCSGQFQATTLAATGVLSDGTSLDVTAYSTLSSSNQTVAALSPAPRVAGAAPGAAVIAVGFHGAQVALPITVSDASVHAVSVAMLGVPPVFEDVPGAVRALSLAVGFEDGAVLTLSAQSASWPWVRAPDLLAAVAAFASSYPPAVAVGASTGVARLLGNWHQTVNLSVMITPCDSYATPAAYILTIPNLMPGTDGDVDIGATGGLPVPPMSTGSSLVLSIYVRSDAPLKSFELLLALDALALPVFGCTPGADWAGGFSCRTNDPVGSVLLAGADAVGTRTGARIHVADVQVGTALAGVTFLSGVILRVASSAGATGCAGCPMVAGAIAVPILGSASRRRLLSSESSPAALPRARRLLYDTGYVYGDVDGDGRFDTADCLMTQEYFLNLRLGPGRPIGCPANGGNGCQASDSLTAWQRRQMDQVADPLAPPATPDYRDFSFMLRVYTNNERFLASWAVETNLASGFSLRVLLLDSLGLPASSQCRVLFVLATAANARLRFSTNAAQTRDGLLIAGVNLGFGWHEIQSLGPPLATENITFALLLETYDALGQSTPDRRFPFYGTTVPPYDQSYQAYVPFGQLTLVAPPLRSATPPPTPPPEPLQQPPLGLTACCDATVTFPASPARRFLPTAYAPTRVSVLLANGTALAQPWADLAYTYDTQLLDLARPASGPPSFALRSAPYSGPIVTRIVVRYAGAPDGAGNASVAATITLTVVDVRNVTLLPDLPNPTPVLYRLYCTAAFQTAAFLVRAYVDEVGPLLASPSEIFLAPSDPRVATSRANVLVPLAAGATDVVVTWWGYTRVYPNLTVLNESIAFAFAHSPAYVFTGAAGETLALQLSVSELVPGAGQPTPPQPLLLPNPSLVTVTAPACVALANTGDAIISAANTLQDEFVAFTFQGCAGASLTLYAPVIVNLSPGPYDLDLGLEGPVLALEPEDSGIHPSIMSTACNRHASHNTHLARQGHGRGCVLPHEPLDLPLLRDHHVPRDHQRRGHSVQPLQHVHLGLQCLHQPGLRVVPQPQLVHVHVRVVQEAPVQPVLARVGGVVGAHASLAPPL